jgi:lysophospholipase L1-like esterase
MNNKLFSAVALILLIVLSSFRIQNEKKNINLVFIGDSITHGARLKDYTTQAPPVFAIGYLQKQNSLGNIQFSNQGVSGYTTIDFLPETRKAWPKVIAAANTLYNDKSATLVFCIMLGTNDSAISGPNGAPVTPQKYRANLKTIADSLFAHYSGCKIVINHPIWYSTNTANGHSTYLQEGLTRLQSYFNEIDNLVKEYKQTRPNQVFRGDKKGFGYFKKHYETDLGDEKGPQGTFYLHPNQKGAKALGELWGKAINKALK